MATNTLTITINGSHTNAGIDFEPDNCPYCHSKIVASRLAAYYCSEAPRNVKVVYRCPNKLCNEIFVANYSFKTPLVYNFSGFSGGSVLKINFDPKIKTVSPSFVRIFNEASEAEHMQLGEIAGVGYRKSLEFLIKDYVNKKKPTEEEAIKKMALSKVIEQYIEDSRIKNVAKRAVWLGNDETHYFRKWEDKSIKELKQLIDLTLHWIEMEALTEETLAEMPEPKK